MLYLFFLYWSPSLFVCRVFNSIWSNIDEVLSINPSANVFVFGDLDVDHKDCLTYSGGTAWPGELCYNFHDLKWPGFDLTGLICDSQQGNKIKRSKPLVLLMNVWHLNKYESYLKNNQKQPPYVFYRNSYFWCRCFPVNLVKVLGTPFCRTPLDDCFWTMFAFAFLVLIRSILLTITVEPTNLFIN